jgi:hypothetical protein
MPTIDPEELTKLCAELIQWAEKLKEFEELSKSASAEMKAHYDMVLKDYQWRIQNKSGKLWYYICGCEEMNPFKTG